MANLRNAYVGPLILLSVPVFYGASIIIYHELNLYSEFDVIEIINKIVSNLLFIFDAPGERVARLTDAGYVGRADLLLNIYYMSVLFAIVIGTLFAVKIVKHEKFYDINKKYSKYNLLLRFLLMFVIFFVFLWFVFHFRGIEGDPKSIFSILISGHLGPFQSFSEYLIIYICSFGAVLSFNLVLFWIYSIFKPKL